MKTLLPTSVLLLAAALFLTGSQLALGASALPHQHRSLTGVGPHKLTGPRTPKPPAKPPTPAPKPVTPKPGQGPTQTTGSIVQTDQMWVCRGPVNLDSVTVTMSPATIGARRDEDAVHLEPGCTGRIGQINIVQWAGDGIKAAQGVHDLTIGGGSIVCPGKAPNLHQDGVQVMGGSHISFSNMTINCGRQADRLIDSNFFVKEAGQSSTPPSDVTCDHCTFGGWTAHTVNIEASLRSGVTNSVICVGRFPKLTMTIGGDAVSPVNSGNTVAAC